MIELDPKRWYILQIPKVGAIHELPLLRIIRETCPELVEGFVVQVGERRDESR